jgi:hypothetical protein
MRRMKLISESEYNKYISNTRPPLPQSIIEKDFFQKDSNASGLLSLSHVPDDIKTALYQSLLKDVLQNLQRIKDTSDVKTDHPETNAKTIPLPELTPQNTPQSRLNIRQLKTLRAKKYETSKTLRLSSTPKSTKTISALEIKNLRKKRWAQRFTPPKKLAEPSPNNSPDSSNSKFNLNIPWLNWK